jgi:hypothetical protein
MDVEMPGKEELRLWNKWMQGIFKHFTRKTLAGSTASSLARWKIARRPRI